MIVTVLYLNCEQRAAEVLQPEEMIYDLSASLNFIIDPYR